MSDVAIYEKMKDSKERWLGDIPATWNTRLLKYMFSIKKNIAGETGHQVLSVTQKGIVPKNMTERGQFSLDYSKYQLVEAGDFVMNHMDLLTGWVDISKYDGVTSPDYRVFVNTDPTVFHSGYYRYIFQHCYTNRVFYGLGQGVAGFGRWRLPANMFMNFVLPVPPIVEQERIARFLNAQCSQIDSLISETKASIEEYTSLKESIIYETMTQGLISGINLKDTGIEEIGCVPEHWEIRKTGEITKKLTDFVASGSFASLKENVQYLDQPDYAQLIRTVDLSESSERQPVYISEDAYNFLHNSNLYGGEIILSNIGSVGSVYQYKPMYQFASLAPNAIMLDFNGNNRFFYYWFSNPKVKTALRLLGGNAVQCKFNKTQLRQLRIINPPLNEQNEIANYLDRRCGLIDEIIQEKENILCALKKYKSSIIYESVTGKRKVV